MQNTHKLIALVVLLLGANLLLPRTAPKPVPASVSPAPASLGAITPTADPLKTDVTANSAGPNEVELDFYNQSDKAVKYTEVRIKIFRESGSAAGNVSINVYDPKGNIVSDKFSVAAADIEGTSTSTADVVVIPLVDGLVLSDETRSPFRIEVVPSAEANYKLYLSSLGGEEFGQLQANEFVAE